MKKITLLILSIILFSCSSDSNNEKKLPEKFDIKIEIISDSGYSPNTHISINSSVVKQWNSINLPFEGSHTYFTTGNEIGNASCKCIKISAWAYLSQTDDIESFNLYVDGDLVDTTNIIATPESNGTMNPTMLEFVYNP